MAEHTTAKDEPRKKPDLEKIAKAIVFDRMSGLTLTQAEIVLHHSQIYLKAACVVQPSSSVSDEE